MLTNDNKPSCFISYAWKNTETMEFVSNIAELLEEKGIRVFWDKKDNFLSGSNISTFIVNSVYNSDCIIVVCTPEYINAITDSDRVLYVEWNEILNKRMLDMKNDNPSIINILLSDDKDNSIPVPLKNNVFIDFSDKNLYSEHYLTLIQDIFKIYNRNLCYKCNTSIVPTSISSINYETVVLFKSFEDIFAEKSKELCGMSINLKFSKLDSRYIWKYTYSGQNIYSISIQLSEEKNCIYISMGELIDSNKFIIFIQNGKITMLEDKIETIIVKDDIVNNIWCDFFKTLSLYGLI
jgi:hypothetical protein